jgi:hypothetical protein
MGRVHEYNQAAAKERQRQSPGRPKSGSEKGAPVPGQVKADRSGRSAHQTAKEIGVGHTTVTKAKKVQKVSAGSTERCAPT